jgi:non-ribosomal peptide synthetase-like protein
MKIHFGNVEMIGNEMVIGPIEIGADAVVGNSCVIGGGARIGAGAELEDLTSIPADGIVGPGEIWDGSPGRKAGMVDLATVPDFPQAGSGRRFAQGLVYTAGYLLILMLGLVPIFPAFYVLYNLDSFIKGYQDTSVAWTSLPMLAWPTAFALVVVSVLIIIAFRWIVLPRVKAGSYSIHSWFYVRKWLVALATEVTLETLNSLYATLYMRHWYRLMGAKIGRGSEISTNLAGRYDLVDIGEDNFLGDEVIFGDEEIRRGWMILKPVKTGDRVFVGNDAVIAAGSVLADDTLIGVKSKMPDSLRTGVDETWFGSPAISVPARQRIQMGEFFTYRPPRSYIVRRAIFEAFHTSLPTAIFITFGYMTADLMSDPLERGDILGALGIFLASGVAIALVLVFVAAAIKWLLMGVYKPINKPMWSWWAMKTEAVAVLYGGLVGKASLEFTRGTPFLPMALRVFGTKIGRGVYMDSTDVTEFDCVHIGDFAVLNDHAVLQTHLYEDRIMKVGRIEVGRGVSVGTSTKVLYDTKVGDYARLGSLTVVMRGESIPGHTEWEGAPAIPVVHRAAAGAGSEQALMAAQ